MAVIAKDFEWSNLDHDQQIRSVIDLLSELPFLSCLPPLN